MMSSYAKCTMLNKGTGSNILVILIFTLICFDGFVHQSMLVKVQLWSSNQNIENVTEYNVLKCALGS